MFSGCQNINKIENGSKLPSGYQGNFITSDLFYNCSSLIEIPSDFFNNFIKRNLQYTKYVL